MNRILNYKWLIIIVILGLFLRVNHLADMPPALNWDEVSHGYNAYSILKTTKDEWGQFLPITNFRAYGDYPLPLNLYLTIPSIYLLGLNEFTVRLPHAILGTITIIAVYFFVKGLTGRAKLALLASFLISLEPWTLFTSRVVLQSNVAIFFLTLAMAFFFNREKNKYFIPLTFLFSGLTLFSYHSTRIFTPLLLLTLVIFYIKEIGDGLRASKNIFILTLIVVVVFILPLPFILLSPESRARSNVVFIINDGAINEINNLRNKSNLAIKKIVYNKVTYFSVRFVQNYMEYFTPKFLFLEGGTQYQFSVPKHGLMYLVNMPFFYIGLLVVIAKSKGNKNYLFLLAWLLLAPIPAAITTEARAVLRASTMLPIPQIIVAIGFFEILRRLKTVDGIVIALYFLALIFSFENYANSYIKDYKVNYSRDWQYGYKEVNAYVTENYSLYDKVLVTKKYGEPHEFFLFYMKYDPFKYQTDPNLIRFYQSNWYWVDHFDKFYFINDWQIKPDQNMVFTLESRGKVDCNYKVKRIKCLLVTGSEIELEGWKRIKAINFLDHKLAFNLYENY